jgi:integrase
MGGKTTITTVSGQAALRARPAIYWHRLQAGWHVGMRKTRTAQTWYARCYDGTKQVRRALGAFDDLPPSGRFDAAAKAAREWCEHVTGGGSASKPVTVRQACERYAKKNQEAEGRFQRYVYGEPIAKTKLAKLTSRQVRAWREKLAATPAPTAHRKDGKPKTRPRTDSSVNRDMTALRAALNQAFEQGDVLNDHAWRVALKPIKNADRSRDVYLDRKERKALIEALPDDAAAFARGLCALPLRPGALAALRVGDFEKRTGSLKIGKDKSGKDRRIKLPTATVELFKAQARSKLPATSLFTRADGAAWDKDKWKGPIKDAVRAAGLADNVTAYALRHSTITDLIVAGVPLLTVAQLAGTSVAMIERHYGHLLQEQATAALSKLVV